MRIGIFIALLLVAIAGFANNSSPILDDDPSALLPAWFAIDTRFPADVDKELVSEDGRGSIYHITFIADDSATVTGTLAMPRRSAETCPLALVMHPMGTDRSLWLSSENPIAASRIVDGLRDAGYAVLALDARLHGRRKVEGIGPREIIGFARGDNPTPYVRMIADSVRDYRLALQWAGSQSNLRTDEILVAGYSMGAQMTLLLASVEPRVSTVLTMVPPYVGQPLSPVAPRNHVGRITDARVLMMVARNDPYSTPEQNQQVFDALATSEKRLVWYDSGHVLPLEYLEPALTFLARPEASR